MQGQETQPNQGGGIDIMTIQNLPRHKDLKTTMTLHLKSRRVPTGYALRARCAALRSGQVTTHIVKRAAVRSALDRINNGIKHTKLVES